MQKLVYGYWSIRALGQIGRLLLHYFGVDFEEVRYDFQKNQQWFNGDKQKLGLDFPNLPYIIDGDFNLTESKAVQLYIIKKFGDKNLLGKTVQDEAIVDEIDGVFEDGFQPLLNLLFDQEHEKHLGDTMKKVDPKFDILNKFYGEKEFALGYLTLADFKVAEFSHWVENIAPQTYKKFPFLKRTRQAFNKLPKIKDYYEKETSVKGPFVVSAATIRF